MKHPRSPWLFVPSLYFQQGVPVIIVQQVSVILYKRLGMANDQIGLWTSLIVWPWILKMLWGPLVDLNWKKRNWVLSMQSLVVLALLGCAWVIPSPSFLPLTLGIFTVTAILSATHDIALDGYYMLALPKSKQAFFMGIRSTFFRLAMIFGSGILVMLAGNWEQQGVPIPKSWQSAFFVGAAVYFLLMLYAHWAAPRLPHDGPVQAPDASHQTSFLEALKSFFSQPRIIPILFFILTYRFGESMLVKMAGPFFLDQRSSGGLGLTTSQVGMIIGNIGVGFLVLGGLIGGFLISKHGLRKCLWPMAITMNAPNIFYIWAAAAQPSLLFIGVLTAVEQFSYGFGMASYMVFAMYTSQNSRYATSHYAITTGLMALGAMIAGIASGFIQQAVGYFWFFICVCISTLPGMILLWFIPLNEEEHAHST